MTISSTYGPVQYTGNGVTTVFAFPYEFYNSTDLTVKSTVIATGVTTTLASGIDYVVSGGSGSTGNVTFVSAPAATVRITIERSIPYTQGQDYQENTAFPAQAIETGFDKSVLLAQQSKAIADYAVKFPATDPLSSIGEIPDSVTRANAIFSFGADGKPAVVSLGSLGSAVNVSLVSPQNGDALTYNAGTWTNRSTLASLGTNIASATTTAISAADSDFVTVTGTTTITSFGTPASFARKHIWVVFSGALTLTHNATSLILPGGASITTAAGDVAECVHISGANWRVVSYEKANGTSIVSPSTTAAANTVKTNNTASTAAPIDLALNNSEILGRGSTGNISALTLGAGLSMSGTVINASTGINLISRQVFTSSGTYTPSAGMQYCDIEVVGGGGGGGAGTGAGTGGGGGGGAGGYSRKLATAATIGASQSITIGSGGAAGTSGGGTSGTGGTTSLGAIISATGGSGGGNGSGSGTTGAGGQGGVGSSGDLNTRGGYGVSGIYIGASGGGAGGSGGASYLGGNGMGGNIPNQAGVAGAVNSGGGGGGGTAGTANGGAGGSGIVVITEYRSV